MWFVNGCYYQRRDTRSHALALCIGPGMCPGKLHTVFRGLKALVRESHAAPSRD